MYYGSGTGGRRCMCNGQALRVHSPDGSTFLSEMTLWPPYWKYDVISEIRLRQSMRTIFTEEEGNYVQLEAHQRKSQCRRSIGSDDREISR